MISELRRDDPASVGSYRLLGRLGTGGMGQVFLGQSPGGRLVAVKVIRPELADEAGFRARFAREVTAARNVSGLFTALVVDADPEAPVPWLATAYVSGPSLAEAVNEHGPLPAPSVLALGAGLAEGLGVIHAAGVVHRDLKPANVLLAHDGPRVIDFGIARALETSMLTQSGTVMGSPGFMSPEQAEGAEVGPPSDVFSLGAVLAFAATGEGPFGSGPTPALLYRVVNRDPDLDGQPEQVRPLVERCLAKDPPPGRRPRSCSPSSAAPSWPRTGCPSRSRPSSAATRRRRRSWPRPRDPTGPPPDPSAATPGGRPATWRAPPGPRLNKAARRRRWPPGHDGSAGARWPGWGVPWRWPPRRP
jgi:serine/threonine protein kinase